MHAEDWVTGTGWSSTAIYSLPGVCGGAGRGLEFQTHTQVHCETDIPQLRPVTSLPSGSRRGRQTQRLPGLQDVEDGIRGKKREKQREGVKIEKEKRSEVCGGEIRGESRMRKLNKKWFSDYNNVCTNIKAVTVMLVAEYERNSYLRLPPVSRIPGFGPRGEAAGQ